MEIDKKLLFATPLWTTMIPGYRILNRKLLMDTLYYPPGGEWELFNLDGEGISEFKAIVLESAESAARDWGIEFKNIECRGRQHVLDHHRNDPPHHHPLADGLIGVYYLKVQDDCGDFMLHDSRGFTNDVWKDPHVKTNKEKKRPNFPGLCAYRIEPEEGKLILLPSYAMHSVETNLSNDIRISLVTEFRFS